MAKVFIKPKEGIKVRDPHTKQYLPEEGAFVELSSYWKRRLKDGDVIEEKLPKKSKVVKKDNDNKD
jgi:hypothetical protein